MKAFLTLMAIALIHLINSGILTDTYPDSEGFKTLILWNVQSRQRIDIGRFYGPMRPMSIFVCDLHPRWSRDGQQVCIDSIHEGSRQMYVLDVSGIVG
jgi:Tol biopolymer transport system component